MRRLSASCVVEVSGEGDATPARVVAAPLLREERVRPPAALADDREHGRVIAGAADGGHVAFGVGRVGEDEVEVRLEAVALRGDVLDEVELEGEVLRELPDRHRDDPPRLLGELEVLPRGRVDGHDLARAEGVVAGREVAEFGAREVIVVDDLGAGLEVELRGHREGRRLGRRLGWGVCRALRLPVGVGEPRRLGRPDIGPGGRRRWRLPLLAGAGQNLVDGLVGAAFGVALERPCRSALGGLAEFAPELRRGGLRADGSREGEGEEVGQESASRREGRETVIHSRPETIRRREVGPVGFYGWRPGVCVRGPGGGPGCRFGKSTPRSVRG